VNIGRVVAAVVGSLIAYIIATELIDGLITGTSTGDTLISNVVPIVVAAGVDGKAPHSSNVMVTTGQIQGNLSWDRNQYGNPELNSGNEPDKCAETRGFASFKQDDGIVRTLAKVRLFDITFARHTQRIHCLVA